MNIPNFTKETSKQSILQVVFHFAETNHEAKRGPWVCTKSLQIQAMIHPKDTPPWIHRTVQPEGKKPGTSHVVKPTPTKLASKQLCLILGCAFFVFEFVVFLIHVNKSLKLLLFIGQRIFGFQQTNRTIFSNWWLRRLRQEEDVEMTEDAKELLTKIGVESTLRPPVHLWWWWWTASISILASNLKGYSSIKRGEVMSTLLVKSYIRSFEVCHSPHHLLQPCCNETQGWELICWNTEDTYPRCDWASRHHLVFDPTRISMVYGRPKKLMCQTSARHLLSGTFLLQQTGLHGWSLGWLVVS